MLHNLLRVLLTQMNVDLCRIQIGVSQPLLQLKGRDSLLCFVCREGVPEGVTTRPFGNAGTFRILDDELSDTPL